LAAVEPAVSPDETDSATPATGKHNLLYGLHPVAAAWVNPRRQIRHLFVTEAAIEALEPAFERAHTLELERPEPTLLDKAALDKLLPAGAPHQGAALDAVPLPFVDLDDVIAATAGDPQALVVVLDQVSEPVGIGAVMRSAAAFGARAVIVPERTAPPLTGLLARTAAGAVDAVPLVRVGNIARAIDDLKQAGYWSVGIDESGERRLDQLDLSGRSVIVLGPDGEVLRKLAAERCDEVARLPTLPANGSLNIAAAAAVALYEVARRR
jgi:23S rRNA (guanosine2251-2'-O)-methyltransferase